MTEYELGRLRLQAFALLDGWGSHNEKGLFVPHNLERRKELAVEFVDWATALAEPTKEQANQIIAEAIDLKKP